MVEVFKTNVKNSDQANLIIDRIRQAFMDYEVNFDLDDCDKILRVKSLTGVIHTALLISFLRNFECIAEVLHDTVLMAE